MREPSLRRARKPSARARGGGRGRVRETPQTCPGPPEGQRSPARGAQGRGATVKGAPGHLRRSWCPGVAKSEPRRPRAPRAVGRQRQRPAFHRPNCASGSEHEGRRGVQGSGKWNIPCTAIAPSVAGDIVWIVREGRTDLFCIGAKGHDAFSYGLQINHAAAILRPPSACTAAREIRLHPHKSMLALLAHYNFVNKHHSCAPSQHIEVVCPCFSMALYLLIRLQAISTSSIGMTCVMCLAFAKLTKAVTIFASTCAWQQPVRSSLRIVGVLIPDIAASLVLVSPSSVRVLLTSFAIAFPLYVSKSTGSMPSTRLSLRLCAFEGTHLPRSQ